MGQAPELASRAATPSPFANPAAQPPVGSSTGGGGDEKESSPSGNGALFEPAAENMTWDGKTWNTTDKSLFQARFEKYLDAPEETTPEDRQYQAIISKVLELTAHGAASPKNIDAALRLLPDGSRSAADARLCDSLADALSSALQGGKNQDQLAAIQAKVEFQALIVQLFLQRRFQHVLMATHFYRAVFPDGDARLNLGKDKKDLFERSAGMPPTVGTLDSMATDAIRDVREGVRSYEFLLQKNELESAARWLAESFTVGEYLPEIRTLPREKKRLALDFIRNSASPSQPSK